MMTMGCDFTYMQAEKWFKSMDQLISMLNSGVGDSNRETPSIQFHAFYSTPREYAAMKTRHISKHELPRKTGDHLPYADGPHMFWTGFYTSRPAFKRTVRKFSSYYNALRVLDTTLQLRAVSVKPAFNDSTFLSLASAMGVAQHHDAITGTAKQHVSNDYTKRLSAGLADAVASLSANLKSAGLLHGELHVCDRANTSLCPLMHHSTVEILVFNPRSKPFASTIFVPSKTKTVVVKDHQGAKVSSATYSNHLVQDYDADSGYTNALPFTTGFSLKLKSLESKILTLNQYSNNEVETPAATLEPESFSGAIETNAIKIQFSEDGLISSVTNKVEGLTRKIKQSWCFYESSVGNDVSWQSSGPYIFRPNSSKCEAFQRAELRMVVNSDVAIIVEQKFSPWISQRIIVSHTESHFNIEFTVGPIPLERDSNVGKEIIMKFESDIQNEGRFFTDANGLEMMQRLSDHRSFPFMQTEPIAGNYYPVTTALSIKDSEAQLLVAVDATVGGSSLMNGEMELMVHRVALKDDWRGVAEMLNETDHITSYVDCEWKRQFGDVACGTHVGRQMVVRGQFSIHLTSAKANFREYTEATYRHPVTFFVNGSSRIADLSVPFDPQALPEVVELVTLQRFNTSTLLVRFANTQHCGATKSCGMNSVSLVPKQLFPFLVDFSVCTTTGNAARAKRNGDRVQLQPQEIVTLLITSNV